MRADRRTCGPAATRGDWTLPFLPLRIFPFAPLFLPFVPSCLRAYVPSCLRAFLLPRPR